MNIAELSRVDKSIEIKAPPDRVFRALTDPAELSAWFQMKIDGQIAAGQCVWMTTTSPQYPGQRFRVWFIELTPPTRFVWQWHPGAVDPAVDYDHEPRTTVTFTLEPSSAGTRLHVAETGFGEISLQRRAKVFKDNDQGWAEVVTWIRDHVQATH